MSTHWNSLQEPSLSPEAREDPSPWGVCVSEFLLCDLAGRPVNTCSGILVESDSLTVCLCLLPTGGGLQYI